MQKPQGLFCMRTHRRKGEGHNAGLPDLSAPDTERSI